MINQEIIEASERALETIKAMSDEELLEALESVEDHSLSYAFECMKNAEFVEEVNKILSSVDLN